MLLYMVLILRGYQEGNWVNWLDKKNKKQTSKKYSACFFTSLNSFLRT